jgi:restriction endonuclease S subunit
LTFDLLGSLQIPYSPIEIQKKIVQHWQDAQTSIKRKYRTIETLKSETDKQFFRVLSLEPQLFSKLTKSFTVQWKNLMRWGVNYNQMAQIGMDLSKSKYKPVQLCSILSRMQYGTNSKANTDGHGVPMIRMNNIVDGQLDLRDIKHIVLSERDKNNLLLKEGDILINRTNSKELVGKCAVFHERSEFVFASYLIRMETNEKAEPDFVCYALNSSIGRQQIDSISRQIIGQANINTEEISSLQIPLPPIKVQRDIIQRCEEDRTEISRICENVELLSQEIEGEIEKLILGEKKIWEN